MKNRWLLFGIICSIAGLALYHSHIKSDDEHGSAISEFSPIVISSKNEAAPASRVSVPLSRTVHSYTKRASEFSDVENAKLTQDFRERYKPLVEKWLAAYEGRVPFDLDEFTLDKFNSRLDGGLYTFMIGDTTLTIQDSKSGLKVFYLMTRKAALEMNKLPGNGFVPDVKLPVTREEVIRMVKADSGVEFKPNEVIMRPTALATALNGGAFVSTIPTGADPNNGLSSKIDLVFNADGTLVNYQRDPFF